MKILKYNTKASWKLLLIECNGTLVPFATDNGYQDDYRIDLKKLQHIDTEWHYKCDKEGYRVWDNDKGSYTVLGKTTTIKHLKQSIPFTFEATLRYTGAYHGRSSFCFKFALKENPDYCFCMPDAGIRAMMVALRDGKMHIVDGCIKGTWKWQKKGSNVSIVPVLDN